MVRAYSLGRPAFSVGATAFDAGHALHFQGLLPAAVAPFMPRLAVNSTVVAVLWGAQVVVIARHPELGRNRLLDRIRKNEHRLESAEGEVRAELQARIDEDQAALKALSADNAGR